MGLSISPVETEDVDLLVRKVELPAHQDGPLHRFMFPCPGDQKESEIRWMMDGLLETVYRENETLFKACGEEGLSVGLIGWALNSGALSERMNGGNRIQNSPTWESKAKQGKQVKPRDSLIPPSLDVTSWLGISKRLREERQRVLQGPQENEICRKSAVSLNILMLTYVPQESPPWPWIQVINDKVSGPPSWRCFVATVMRMH
jgi:hypothetical protein